MTMLPMNLPISMGGNPMSGTPMGAMGLLMSNPNIMQYASPFMMAMKNKEARDRMMGILPMIMGRNPNNNDMGFLGGLFGGANFGGGGMLSHLFNQHGGGLSTGGLLGNLFNNFGGGSGSVDPQSSSGLPLRFGVMGGGGLLDVVKNNIAI